MPNGVFESETGRFLELPPPDDEEVEALLEKIATRTVRLLRRRGLLDEEAFPEDGLQACQAASLHFSAEEEPYRRSARSTVTRDSSHTVTSHRPTGRGAILPLEELHCTTSTCGTALALRDYLSVESLDSEL
jgi:hypothetical protein